MKKSKWILIGMSVLYSQLTFAAPVNINTGSAEAIAEALYGVGKNKAQAIVEYRTKHGPFKSVEDIKKVKGIGQAIVDGNGEDIKIE